LTGNGTLREDFENAADWAVNSCAVANDAVNYKTGTQSVKCTADVGANGFFQKGGLAWDLSLNQEVRFWFYVADSANVALIRPRLLETDGVLYMNGPALYYKTGWNLVSVKTADWTASGGMTWNDTIGYLKIYVSSQAGVQAVVSFDSFYTDVVARPALVMTFDDGHDSVWDYAVPVMRDHNMLGTAYIITDNIGAANYISANQLLALHHEGWTIANHTKTHADLTGIAQAAAQAELDDAEAALIAIGITGNGPLHCSYPGGAYNSTVRAAVAAAGMLTARSIDTHRYPVLPFDQPDVIQLGKQFGNTLSLAQAKTWVDGLITRNEIGIALFHLLVTGTPANTSEWNVGDFEDFCEYVAGADIPCITIEDAYQIQTARRTVPMPRG